MWGFLLWLKSLERMFIKKWLMLQKHVLLTRRMTTACVTDYRLEKIIAGNHHCKVCDTPNGTKHYGHKKTVKKLGKNTQVTTLQHSEKSCSIYSYKNCMWQTLLLWRKKTMVRMNDENRTRIWSLWKAQSRGQVAVWWFYENIWSWTPQSQKVPKNRPSLQRKLLNMTSERHLLYTNIRSPGEQFTDLLSINPN